MAQNLLCPECSTHNIAQMFLPFKRTIATTVSTANQPQLIERPAADFFTHPDCPFCRLVAGMISAAPISVEAGDVCSLQRKTYAYSYEDIYEQERRDPSTWFHAPAWSEEYIESASGSQVTKPSTRSYVATMTLREAISALDPEATEQLAVGFAELVGYVYPEGGGYSNSQCKPWETTRIQEKHTFRLRAMQTSETLEGRLLRARRVGRDRVDMDLLRSWVLLCEENHDISTASPFSVALVSDLTLSVIDVKNNCLVTLPQGMQYATLSYVWGPPSIPQLCWTRGTAARLLAIGGLDKWWNDVPTTIADAMAVCKNLGIRYLWVDALCIQQDDDVMRAGTIAQMDSVYTSSFLTLVCASGRDSWSGFPGVRQGSRDIVKLVEDVQGVASTNARLDYKEAEKTFEWKRRGWTVQEEFLSSRLLIFSEHQAFFRCRHAVYSEDTVTECSTSEGTRLGFGGFTSELHHADTPYASEITFEDMTSELSARQLTNSSDVLDAFAGIGRHLRRKCGWTFWQGLPLEVLDAALVFKCEDRFIVRHALFPSWSWADWKGRGIYWIGGRWADNRGRFTCAIGEVEWFRWVDEGEGELGHYQQVKNDQIRKYDTDANEIVVACLLRHWPLIAQRRNLWSRLEIYPGLHDVCDKAPPSLSRSTAMGLAAYRASWKVPRSQRPPLPRPPSTLSQKELTTLITFQTSFAWLQVENVYEIPGPDQPSHETETMYLYYLKRPEDYPGSSLDLVLGASWQALLDPKGIEVIVISRTPSGKHSKLELMPIYTDDRGVSVRLAASASFRLEDNGWELLNPRWRTVFLV